MGVSPPFTSISVPAGWDPGCILAKELIKELIKGLIKGPINLSKAGGTCFTIPWDTGGGSEDREPPPPS